MSFRAKRIEVEESQINSFIEDLSSCFQLRRDDILIFFKKILNLFPIYKFKISGNSMSSILKPGQIVLVNRLSYLFKIPKTNDIIALKDPRDGKTLIKRISEIKNSQYFVNGDNQKESTDSRVFGWIKRRDIIGKVVYITKSKS